MKAEGQPSSSHGHGPASAHGSSLERQDGKKPITVMKNLTSEGIRPGEPLLFTHARARQDGHTPPDRTQGAVQAQPAKATRD